MDITKLAKGDKGQPEPNLEIGGTTLESSDAAVSASLATRMSFEDRARLEMDSYLNSGAPSLIDWWKEAISGSYLTDEYAGEMYRKSLQQKLSNARAGGEWGGSIPTPPGEELPMKGDLNQVNNLMSISEEDYGEDGWTIGSAPPRSDMPEKRLKQRAAKGAIALDDTPENMLVQMGDPEGEQLQRERAVYKDQDEFRAAKQKYLDEVIKSRDPDKPLSLDEAVMIQNLTQSEFVPNDPQAMEKLYAQKVTQRLIGSGSPIRKVDPELADTIMDATEAFVIKKEFLQKKFEDGNKRWDETSLFGKIWDVGEQLIPFKSTLDQYNWGAAGWMPGANKEEQAQNLWMLPPKQFIPKVEEAYNAIAAHNQLDADEWLHSILSYGRVDSTITDSMFGIDVASILPFGTLGKALKGGKAVNRAGRASTEGLKNAPKTTVKAVSKDFKTDAERLAEGYDIGEVDFPRNETRIIDNTDDYKTDGERLIDGWDVGEVDFPEEFRAAQQAQQTAKSLAKEEQTLEDTLAKTGHQNEAIDLSVQKQLDQVPGDVRDPSEFKNLSSQLNSMYNPRNWLGEGTRLTREASDRILNGLEATKANLASSLVDPGQALRLSGAALAKAIEITKSKLRDEFRFANDGVIDTRWVVTTQSDNPETQLNRVTVTLGDVTGLAFKTAEHAKQQADHLYKLRQGDYKIVQDGDFYIQVTRPIDESDPEVAKAMIETYNETPRSLWNTFLGWFRNPDDLLSMLSRDNRKAVTHSAQDVMYYFEQATKGIGKLTPKQQGRMNRIMTVNRDSQLGDQRGKWFDSAGEFEQEYYNLFKQYPSESETKAYMITREMSDFDWSVKSLTILRDKSRLGLRNIHTRLAVPADLEEVSLGSGIDSPRLSGQKNYVDIKFEGKFLDELPVASGKEDPGVYILKDGESIGTNTFLRDVDHKEIKRLVDEEGYRIVQQADPANNPFAAIDSKVADRQFIIMKNPQTSELRANDMLPYKPGYHVEYAPGFYTKAGRFFRDAKGRMSYSGDTSILYHVSEAAAKKYTTAFDKARLLLKDGKSDELRAFLPQQLPHTYEDFVRMYSDGTLDIDTPVLYTKSGQSTRDSVKSGGQGAHWSLYEDARDVYGSQYNLTQSVNRQFTQEKNIALPSVTKGSEGNPVISFTPAKLIDPLASMSRSANKMARMRVYDNYQHQAITSLIEEFFNPETMGGSMSKRTLDSARANPLAAIMDPMWEEKALSRDKLAAAKNAHRAVVNLLGVQSPVSKNVDWVLNKVVDSIFEKWGDGAASKASNFLTAKMSDPARYARSIAFHTKLGLFNPVQIVLQGQSIVHAAAITGNLKRSYEAMGAGMLMRYLSLATDEKIIKSFAKKAKAFGWKEDEFLESFENMKRAGVWHVEGEVADMNDVFDQKLISSKFGKFLDKGTMFFQEGERMVRLNAWNTAYKEWKAVNPLSKLDDRARNQILRRYDDLAINMTRSSTGAWQKGILSIPAQFSTYQIHLMEQLLGKRLTLAEKSRVLATYSALYGIPTGIAVGTAFWPFGQDIKQAAMERGIDVNDGVIDLLMNGIMSKSFEAITGREYNISERYGPNGLTFFKEALNGQKSIMETLLGPSGSILGDILKATDPVQHAVLGIFRDDNDAYPLLSEDFGAVFRNISSVNAAYQAYYALNAGKFISKNGLFTAEADAMDGVMKGIFGLDPRSVSDTYIKIESMREFKDAQNAAQKEVVKNWRRAMENFEDPEAFQTYMKAAKAWLVMGGFRPDQMDQIIREAAGGNTSLIEKVERQWQKNAPVDKQWERQQEHIRKLQSQEQQ